MTFEMLSPSEQHRYVEILRPAWEVKKEGYAIERGRWRPKTFLKYAASGGNLYLYDMMKHAKNIVMTAVDEVLMGEGEMGAQFIEAMMTKYNCASYDWVSFLQVEIDYTTPEGAYVTIDDYISGEFLAPEWVNKIVNRVAEL